MSWGSLAVAETEPARLSEPCLSVLDDSALDEPELLAMRAGQCAAEMSEIWGAEDARLIDLLDRLSAQIAGVPKHSYGALPLRERADELAQAVYGPESLEAGDTALAYVRTMILSGRCRGMDPVAGAYLARARIAFDASIDPERRSDGLRGVAAAYADAQFYELAAQTLESIEEGLAARDWRRIADWRISAGNLDGAEVALFAGLELAQGRSRDRILHRLRTLLFERGKFDVLADLPER